MWPRECAIMSKLGDIDGDEVLACARSILTCAAAVNSPNSRYHAVKRKYGTEANGEVATRYTLPEAI